MKKTSLFIVLLASSIINAEAFEWDGEEDNHGPVIAVNNPEPQVGPEQVGRCYYRGGISIGRKSFRELRYPNGHRIQEEIDSPLPIHLGNRIVYVEHFQVEGEEPLNNNQGVFDFIKDLEDAEKVQNREDGRLIYSDGTNIFLPTITQELWEKDGRRVRFFIASYNEKNRLNFIHQIRIRGNQPGDIRLPQGLYSLDNLINGVQRRVEIWRKLRPQHENLQDLGAAQAETYKVVCSYGCSSIPGIGSMVNSLVPHYVDINNELNIQNHEEARIHGLALNDQISGTLRSEGSRQIIKHFRKQINDHTLPADTLRKRIRTQIQNLVELSNIPEDSFGHFFSRLQNYLSLNTFTDLYRLSTKISQLKLTYGNVRHLIQNWNDSLNETIQKLSVLAQDPIGEVHDGVLTICGSNILGISDIAKIYEQKSKRYRVANPDGSYTYFDPPLINKIIAYGSNTFFLDQNVLKLPGISLFIKTPKWKGISDDCIIDLSGPQGTKGFNGSDGTRGQDGQVSRPRDNNNPALNPTHGLFGTHGSNGSPGLPGKNGGHFWGYFYTKESLNLQVISDGGQGGIGGDGGKGGDGGHGGNASIYKQTGIVEFNNGYGLRGAVEIYHEHGSDGAPGRNGGKAGRGGPGGHTGSATINGDPWHRTLLREGQSGPNGSPGPEGKGGKHGSHSQGRLVRIGGTVTGAQEAHRLESRGNASPGSVINQLSDELPLQAEAQVNLPVQEFISNYSEWYMNLANNGFINPFMRIFPNLQAH